MRAKLSVIVWINIFTLIKKQKWSGRKIVEHWKTEQNQAELTWCIDFFGLQCSLWLLFLARLVFGFMFGCCPRNWTNQKIRDVSLPPLLLCFPPSISFGFLFYLGPKAQYKINLRVQKQNMSIISHDAMRCWERSVEDQCSTFMLDQVFGRKTIEKTKPGCFRLFGLVSISLSTSSICIISEQKF